MIIHSIAILYENWSRTKNYFEMSNHLRLTKKKYASRFMQASIKWQHLMIVYTYVELSLNYRNNKISFKLVSV